MEPSPVKQSSGRPWLMAAVVLSSLAATVTTRAGVLLAPGGSSTIHSSDYLEPRGLLLAEQDLPFTIGYRYPATNGVVGTLPGTLIGTVLRDRGDNTLTFIYDARLDADPPPGAPNGTTGGSRLTLSGFAGHSTDLSGILASGLDATVSRSADGDGVTVAGPSGYPLLVVHTNATTFDAGGTARFAAADRFDASSASAAADGLATGTADIGGTFRPTQATVAVPLPPAAYTALGGVVGCGIVACVRRWMGGAR
jgi:hypothetical protein